MGSSLKYTESPSRGTWSSPWSPFIALPSFLKDATYHDNMEQADSVPRAVVGTKVPAASCGFTGSHSRGGRHGQAYPRIVAAYLHGRVRRRRHVRRNPAPLKAAVARHRRAGVGFSIACWRTVADRSNALSSRAAKCAVIDVSAHGVDRRQRAEPRKYVRAANIPGMDDGIAAGKRR